MRGFVGLLCVVLALFGGTVAAVLTGPANHQPDLLAEHPNAHSLLVECSNGAIPDESQRLLMAEQLAIHLQHLENQVNQRQKWIDQEVSIAEQIVERETAIADLLIQSHNWQMPVKTVQLQPTYRL